MPNSNIIQEYYTGTLYRNVEVYDCLFGYLQAEKDIQALKKNLKRETQIIILQETIDNDIDRIKTKYSI